VSARRASDRIHFRQTCTKVQAKTVHPPDVRVSFSRAGGSAGRI
jgi:hypothetical protein